MTLTLDLVSYWQRRLGMYQATDWEAFFARLGVPIVELSLPAAVPAFTLNRVIFLDRDLSNQEKAEWAWHEAAHLLLHVGSCDWWASRPQGHITVSKWEWQARTFARSFPVWE